MSDLEKFEERAEKAAEPYPGEPGLAIAFVLFVFGVGVFVGVALGVFVL